MQQGFQYLSTDFYTHPRAVIHHGGNSNWFVRVIFSMLNAVLPRQHRSHDTLKPYSANDIHVDRASEIIDCLLTASCTIFRGSTETEGTETKRQSFRAYSLSRLGCSHARSSLYGPQLILARPRCDEIKKRYMGGCQNYGLFWGTLNIRGRIIIETQKGTIILITTHILLQKEALHDSYRVILIGRALGLVLGLGIWLSLRSEVWAPDMGS